MKTIIYHLAVAGLFLFISSCNPSDIQTLNPEPDQGHVLYYKQSSCFGFCDAFEFKLSADGAFQLTDYSRSGHPTELTERGAEVKELSTEELWANIKARAMALHIDQLLDRYPQVGEDLPDLSVRTLIIRLNGVDKKITDIYGAPEELKKFELFLNKMIDHLRQAKNPVYRRNPLPEVTNTPIYPPIGIISKLPH